ncbi:MAG: alpha/beta fold hydrolase [Saprospiraceae bacterium]|nr:alpha/beta fold hydrolase [Saprospiraceae bacterium]
MKKITLLLLSCLLCVIISAQTTPSLSLTAKTLQTVSGKSIEAKMGTLTVPENRNNPGSRTIDLAFVQLKSTSPTPKAPLIYLEGGPGGSSTGYADSPGALEGWFPLLQVCDLIFLDQRGTGRSGGNLRYGSEEPVPADFFADQEKALAHLHQLIQEAQPAIKKRGVDLQGYTSAESADDINDLRIAMGWEKVSLLGFSYGSHLALATIRRHEEHLENVVTIGVEGLDETFKYPLNMDIQMQKLGLMVEEDSNLAGMIPDWNELVRKALARLEANPMQVEIYDRQQKQPRTVSVGKWGLSYILRRDIGDASDLPVFPKLLHSVANGESHVLQWFVQKRWGFHGINLMSQLMDGASGASPERWAMIKAQATQSQFGAMANTGWPELYEVLEVEDLGEEFRAPLISPVRILMLSGSLDWNTPPYQAERLRFGLPNSSHIVVEHAGHEQILPQPQVQRAILTFLMGQNVKSEQISLPKMKFVPIKGFAEAANHPSSTLSQWLFHLTKTEGLEKAMASYQTSKGGVSAKWLEGEIEQVAKRLVQWRRTAEALAFFELNAKENPSSFRAHANLAEAYQESEQTQLAVTHYRKALSLNPEQPGIKDKLSALEKQ